MVRLSAPIALLSVALIGCAANTHGSTVYRDTWQPWTPQDVFPQLLRRALAMEPDDVAMVEHAGGQFIGYHATRKAYSVRAGSVGGTHFVAVAGTTTAHTSCTAAPIGGITVGLCSTSSGFRPTKVAVFRVPLESWPLLPPHLVPPTSEVVDGVQVYATRDGCSVQGAWGTVKCTNDWQVRLHRAPSR
jgi:hypothetical protein